MSNIITLNEWLNIQPTSIETDQRLFIKEDEIRSFKQFEDTNPIEIQNLISTLHNLALTTYDLYCNELKNIEISSTA